MARELSAVPVGAKSRGSGRIVLGVTAFGELESLRTQTPWQSVRLFFEYERQAPAATVGFLSIIMVAPAIR
jgi:hypothetical protein